MKHLLILISLAVTMLLGACSKEPASEPIPGGMRLCLTLDGGAISVQGTRAIDESAVNNLWVLQFNASGSQLTRQYIATITDPAAIELTTALSATANSTLYLVANTGNASLFSSHTLAQAKALTVTLSTTTGGGIPTDASTNLPMVGQSAALTFPVSAAIPVNLTRAVAKVTLTVKNLLTTGYPQLTVTSTQLKNVPTAYSTQIVDAANGFTGTTYYPAASAASFKNYTALTGDIPAAGTTTTYYLAPNVRGVSTNTEPHLKSDATAVAGQGAYCTYVEILGTAKVSATAPATEVRYRLYLGANNTNDFNILSNSAYKVGIELAGLYAVDARLTITTDKFNLTQGDSEGDNTGDAGDGWEAPAIGLYRNGGIIYEVTDAENYKVFSLTEVYSKWAAADTYVLGAGDGQDATDGKKNMAAIKAYFKANTATVGSDFSVAFPAAAHCDAMNTGGVSGWYLPAKDELVALATAYAANKAVLDKAITDHSGTTINHLSDYWSGTECSNGKNAWCVNLPYGSMDDLYAKTTRSPFVRCFKSITPPPAIGDVKDGGVVYYVNGANYKVVSVNQDTADWAAKTTYNITTSDTDARGNAAAIKSYFDTNPGGIITESTFDAAFPAAAWCYNYKGKDNTEPVGTWYLPAKTDLQYLWCAFNGKAPISWENGVSSSVPADGVAQTVFNKYLTDAGGTNILGFLWSSTEVSSNRITAWGVSFSNSVTFGGDKTDNNYVRCVRDF